MLLAQDISYIEDKIDEIIKPLDLDREKMMWPQFLDRKSKTDARMGQLRQDESMQPVHYQGEGQDADELEYGKGYRKRYSMRKRGGTIVLSQEGRFFDSVGKIKEKARKLQLAFSHEEEIVAACLFDLGTLQNSAITMLTYNGFPLLDVEAADGKPFFSAAHTFRTGGITFSNYNSTGSVDQPSIETGLQAVRAWTDSAGARLNYMVNAIITPGKQVENLRRILESPLQSDSAGNPINTLYGVDLIVWNWLTTDTAIYLRTSSPYKPQRRIAWERVKVGDDANNRGGMYCQTWNSMYCDVVYDPHPYYRIG